MANLRTSAACCALILCLALTAGAEPTRIENPLTPRDGVREVVLEELWEVGGDDGDLILGVVNQVLIDGEDNVYLLDGQLSEIHVISPAGEQLRTIGREGDGPGEFRNGSDMAFLPDGSLGVLQGFPGRIVKIDPVSGEPAGNWTLRDETTGGMFQMQFLRHAGGNIVAGGVHQIVDTSTGTITRRGFISNVDPATGLVRQEYVHRDISIDLSALRLDEDELAGGPENRFDVGPRGRVFVAVPRNGYEISVFAPQGPLDLVLTREYETWQRDAQALDIWKRILETVERNQAPGAAISWEQTEPDVQALRVAPDGRVWIQNSRGRWEPPAGVFTCFDVFAPDGTFVEEVRFVCDGRPRSDALFFSGSEYVFRVAGFWDAALSRFGGAGTTTAEGEEPEPVSVTCYRIGS